jgi:tRNA (mo5U34)-methyltransferase
MKVMNDFEKILAYKHWRQRIPMGEGRVSQGYILHPDEWALNHLPARMDGKSFLDVGANDGYFVFDAERRGAKRMVATDLYYDGVSGNMGGWNSTGITLMKNYLHSNVQITPKSIYDIQELGETFDCVLCTNVLSWLDNPNLGLQRLAEVCNETLYLKDGFLMRYDPEPVLQYERAKNLVNFRANLSYVKTLLQAHGFKRIEVVPYYLHTPFEWQLENIPMVTSQTAVSVYELPNAGSTAQSMNCHKAWVTGEEGDFWFVRNLGWVKKSDVTVAPRGKRSLINRLIRAILPEAAYGYYIRKRGSETYVKSHMVIAHKR